MSDKIVQVHVQVQVEVHVRHYRVLGLSGSLPNEPSHSAGQSASSFLL